MKRFQAAMLCAIVLCLCVGAGPVGGQTNAGQAVRLAIVDQGPAVANLPVADLLFKELSSRPNLDLLERQQIDRVLQEQSISLSAVGDQSATPVVSCGKILTADAILLLKMEEDEKKDVFLRARLLETRMGFKLLDTLLSLDKAGKDVTGQMHLLAQRIEARASAGGRGGAGLKLVGVSGFQSEALAGRWNWVGERLTGGIERHLSVNPGLMVLERRAAGVLTDERDLTAKLPEAVRPSAVLINGSYQVSGSNHLLSVTIKLNRGAELLGQFACEGSADDIEPFCASIATNIAAQIGVVAESEMSREEEAELLAYEAEAYNNRREFRKLIALAESAYALVPDSERYQRLLAQSYIMYVYQMENQRHEETPTMEEVNDACLKGIELTERIYRTTGSADVGFVFRASAALLHHRAREGKLNEQSQMILERYRELCKLIPGRLGQMNMFLPDMPPSLAREMSDWILAQVKAADPLLHIKDIVWHAETVAKCGLPVDGWQQYLESLTESADPKVRAAVLNVRMHFYSTVVPDCARVRDSAEKYLRALKEGFSLGSDHLLALKEGFSLGCDGLVKRELRFSTDKRENDRIRAGYLADALGFALEKQIVSWRGVTWGHVADQLADLLEKDQRPKEAAEWLFRVVNVKEDYAYAGHKRSWHELNQRLLELRNRYPEISVGEETDPVRTYKPRIVLATHDKIFEDIGQSRMGLRRLILTPTGPLVVAYMELKFGGNVLAVVRLDWSGRPRSVMKTDQLPGPEWSDGRFTCAVGDDGAVYLGSPTAGLLILDSHGQSRLLNEASNLACQRIQKVAMAGGKLYASVGHDSEDDSGLMEFDPATGESRIVTSEKIEGSSRELDGHCVVDICSDPGGRVLWVLGKRRRGNRTDTSRLLWQRLYRYNPDGDMIERLGEGSMAEKFMYPNGEGLKYGPWGQIRTMGDTLIIRGYEAYVFNLKTSQGFMLRIPGAEQLWKPEWDPGRSIPTVLSQTAMFCPVRAHLAEFQLGTTNHVLIANDLFPIPKVGTDHNSTDTNVADLDVLDLDIAPAGLYVLTWRALYLIPEIK